MLNLTHQSSMLVLLPTGTVIKVLAGNYTEDNPIQVPAFCAITGDDQRTVTVVPNNATSDIFHVRKASKIANMTFTGHRAPAMLLHSQLLTLP